MSDKLKKTVTAIFWVHFAVAAASHVFVILMIGGVVSIVMGTENIGFWLRGLLLGITFYSAMYAINHITEKDGFCVLTDLENFYRRSAEMPLVKQFTPRFYKQCRLIMRSVYRFFRRGNKE